MIFPMTTKLAGVSFGDAQHFKLYFREAINE